MTELPQALRARADVAGSGELLWPAGAALDVLDVAPDLGLAVFAGEVYEQIGEAAGCFRDDWMTRRRFDEPWDEYVTRAAQRAAEEIRATGGGSELRFFLAVCDEAGYPAALDERRQPW